MSGAGAISSGNEVGWSQDASQLASDHAVGLSVDVCAPSPQQIHSLKRCFAALDQRHAQSALQRRHEANRLRQSLDCAAQQCELGEAWFRCQLSSQSDADVAAAGRSQLWAPLDRWVCVNNDVLVYLLGATLVCRQLPVH